MSGRHGRVSLMVGPSGIVGRNVPGCGIPDPKGVSGEIEDESRGVEGLWEDDVSSCGP